MKTDKGPGDDLTVFIPKIPPDRPPIEPLLRLPAWVGLVLHTLAWFVICVAGIVLLFLIARIVLFG